MPDFLESVAVQVTGVSPVGNDSGASFLMTGFGSAISVAVTVPMNTVVKTSVYSAVTSAGAVMVGGVVSRMVIVWVAVTVLSEVSVALHVTVVSPSGNDPGTSFVTDAVPELSTTVAVCNPIR